MNILTKSKRSWTLWKDTLPDGREQILSGYEGTGEFSWAARRTRPPNRTKTDNIIFEARVRATMTSRGRTSALAYFDDEDGLHKCHSSISGVEAILEYIQNGKIRAGDGWLDGVWTFEKQGSGIYLFPAGYTDISHAHLDKANLLHRIYKYIDDSEAYKEMDDEHE